MYEEELSPLTLSQKSPQKSNERGKTIRQFLVDIKGFEKLTLSDYPMHDTPGGLHNLRDTKF